ncbi:MAG: type II toxin-antitoxin system HicB family antitoxin [Pseudonocardiaceae bacterium]
MTERTVTYTATIHDDSDGLWAEVAELPGVFATGSNLAELSAALREGVELYLSTPEHPVRVGDVSSTTEQRTTLHLMAG